MPGLPEFMVRLLWNSERSLSDQKPASACQPETAKRSRSWLRLPYLWQGIGHAEHRLIVF